MDEYYIAAGLYRSAAVFDMVFSLSSVYMIQGDRQMLH